MFSNSTSDNPVLQNTKLDKPEQRHSVLHDGIVIEGDWQSDGIVEFGGKIIGDLTVDVLIVTGTGNVEGNVRARSLLHAAPARHRVSHRSQRHGLVVISVIVIRVIRRAFRRRVFSFVPAALALLPGRHHREPPGLHQEEHFFR